MTAIVPARNVDYSNIEEVCGYRLLLCKLYECEGGFNLPAKRTPVTREVIRQALIWVKEVKSLINLIIDGGATSESSILAAIPSLLSGYDMMYRIANGGPCYEYLREVKLKTVGLWLKGDKSISNTDVTLLLLSEADRDIRTLEKRYADYSLCEMSSWVDDLMRNGTFTNVSLSETYHRLSYLLSANLFTFLGSKEQTKAKLAWARAHLLTDDEIEELDTATLWAYAQFIDAMPFTTMAQYERNSAMYKHLLSKIALRSDTHPYAARAIQLTLNRYEALSA